ncbi:hypothetical protein P3S68_008442 [Capsicum galapagoense]
MVIFQRGAVKLQLLLPKNVDAVTLDPNPDWTFDALLVELNSIEKENLDNSRLQRIILGEPLLCKCLMMMWRIWTEILGMKLVIIFLWEENIYACDEICLRST